MVAKKVQIKRDYNDHSNWPNLSKKGKRLEIVLGKPWHGELILETVSLDPQGRFFIVSYNSQEGETIMSGPSRTYMLQIGTPGNLIQARKSKEVTRIKGFLDRCRGMPHSEFNQVMAMSASPKTAFPDVWNENVMAFFYEVGEESGCLSIPQDKAKPPVVYPGGSSIILERVKMEYPRDKGVELTLKGDPESLKRYHEGLCRF